ncbi:hypothetical protein ACHAPI_005954 [Fusarium lateritium]
MPDPLYEAIGLTVAGSGFIIARIWYLRATSEFAIEDFLMMMVLHGLANNGITMEERILLGLQIDTDEYKARVSGSTAQFAGLLIHTCIFFLLKLAICRSLCRLSKDMKQYYPWVIIGFVLTIFVFAGVVLALALACQPQELNWQINPDPGYYCHPGNSVLDLILTAGINGITYLCVASIPMPILWNNEQGVYKRTAVFLLSAGGWLVAGMGIARCVLVVKARDSLDAVGRAWAARELFVAVSTASAFDMLIVFHNNKAKEKEEEEKKEKEEEEEKKEEEEEE